MTAFTPACPLPTPTRLATTADWYYAYQNIALLFRYLEAHHISYGKASDVLEKPWHWAPEFREALDWHAKEIA